MKAATIDALNRINREFYDSHAAEFSATRSRPWDGWGRATATVSSRLPAVARRAPVTLLDVGCGNGRFGEFIAERSTVPTRYLGVDGSMPLLSLAKERLARHRNLQAAFAALDLTRGMSLGGLDRRPFDLIVVFGLLHHIAGVDNRRQLLERLVAALQPGGHLVVSFWQFGVEKRFHRRVVDWRRHLQQTGDRIDLEDLEAGDLLLQWGEIAGTGGVGSSITGPRRYCHFTDESEADALARSLEVDIVDRYSSDGQSGRLNLYFVLEAKASSGRAQE